MSLRAHLLCGVALLAVSTTASAQSLIDRVAWMQGCWQLTSGERVVDEQWTSPRGGVMLGASRTTRGLKLVDYEFVLLSERDGKLVYHARPSGQMGAEFTSANIDANSVRFENPAHDFPQRIVYERRGDDQLHAWIEGPQGGTTRRSDYPFRRVACPN